MSKKPRETLYMMVFIELLKRHNQLQPRFKPKKSNSTTRPRTPVQVSVPVTVSISRQQNNQESRSSVRRLPQQPVIAAPTLPPAKLNIRLQHVNQPFNPKPSTSNDSARSGVLSFSAKTTQAKQKSNSDGNISTIMPSDFEHLYHAPSNANDTTEPVKRVAEERP